MNETESKSEINPSSPTMDDDYYEGLEDDEDDNATLSVWLPKTPFFVPLSYEISLPDGQTRIFTLDLKQRIFLVLDSPSSW